VSTASFQRARTDAQRDQRRRDVLDAARGMLDQMPLAEISLRELSRRVGLAKSNVVRYFPSREAVFLAVLAEDWDSWLDQLRDQLAAAPPPGTVRPGPVPHERHQELAAAIAGTLAGQRRMCELISAAQTILEHNIPASTAREFKMAAHARTRRLAGLVQSAVPGLTGARAFEFAGLTWALIAGAWPIANPSPVVAQVLAEPGLRDLCVEFGPALTSVLTVVLDGMTITADSGGHTSR
jgi:AcrR family transcriptional regulator